MLIYHPGHGSQHATLGTLLRALLDQLDPAVEQAYRDQLDYRPRYTPVLRTLMAQGPSRIKDLALAGLSHSALSQTVAAMVRDGWLHAANGEDGRERILQLSRAQRRCLPGAMAGHARAARASMPIWGSRWSRYCAKRFALEQRPPSACTRAGAEALLLGGHLDFAGEGPAAVGHAQLQRAA